MFAFVFFEVLPWVMFGAFVMVPVCVFLVRRFGSHGRARRLGYRHHLEGKDISDQFLSEELGLSYLGGQRAARNNLRDVAEYEKQREDRRLLR